MPLSFIFERRRMDELKVKLSTFFMREFVAKTAADIIKKKTGKDVMIELNELEFSVKDGKTHVAIEFDMDAGVIDIVKIINNLT